jgi:hypothetical protein
MNTPRLPTDELFRVELRIARRADQLVRMHGNDPVHALDPWRQAERELLNRLPGWLRQMRRARC